MKTSDAGLDLIKSYEKLRLEAYKPTPDDVWTIGWGHTYGVKEGDTCTEEQAEAWLRADVLRVENCVKQCATVPLTQGEFDALVSFAFNLGCNALRNSTLLRKLNAADYDGAAAEFARWNHQGDKVLAGLTARRAAERELFVA